MEAGRVSRDYQVNYMVKANEDLVAELGKKGMTIIRDVDRSSFLPGAKEVQAQFATKFGGQWADIIQSITEAGK
jgi:TRAP-type C4-dicarboxylate transport system substrate-binding protein